MQGSANHEVSHSWGEKISFNTFQDKCVDSGKQTQGRNESDDTF